MLARLRRRWRNKLRRKIGLMKIRMLMSKKKNR